MKGKSESEVAQSCLTLCDPIEAHLWDSPGKNTRVGCHFLLQCMKGKSESEVALEEPILSFKETSWNLHTHFCVSHWLGSLLMRERISYILKGN